MKVIGLREGNSRLVKGSVASAGKVNGLCAGQMGNAYLRWPFGEAAVICKNKNGSSPGRPSLGLQMDSHPVPMQERADFLRRTALYQRAQKTRIGINQNHARTP
jgi:hypothetical protein